MGGRPAFFEYFSEQNKAVANGSIEGVELTMNTLGVSPLPSYYLIPVT